MSVAPNLRAACNLSSAMSIAKILLAPARDALCIMLSPTPPSPITATVDPNMPEDSAEVTVVLKDGRSIIEKVDHATGAPENPLSDGQLEDKFRNLASRVLPKKRAEKLLSLLWSIDEAEDLREIMALVRP